MLSFSNSVPTYLRPLSRIKSLLICLLVIGSVYSVSAQGTTDSLEVPDVEPYSRTVIDPTTSDSTNPRIKKDGLPRWTNIPIPDSIIKPLDTLGVTQEGIDPEQNSSSNTDDSSFVGNPIVLPQDSDTLVRSPIGGQQVAGRPGKEQRGKTDRNNATPPDTSSAVPSVVELPKIDSTQQDSSNTSEEIVESVVRRKPKPVDTTLSRRKLKLSVLAPPDPSVALRRSLILPGWGQVYNRSAWKVPIIYAGFGGLAYMFVFNHKEYRYHKLAAICISEDCAGYPEFEGFSQENVISTREFHRRYRDMSVIIAGLWYALNGIDAYVEAHLQPFDVSDDLSLRIKPSVLPDPFQQRNVYLGASISLGFRK